MENFALICLRVFEHRKVRWRVKGRGGREGARWIVDQWIIVQSSAHTNVLARLCHAISVVLGSCMYLILCFFCIIVMSRFGGSDTVRLVMVK